MPNLLRRHALVLASLAVVGCSSSSDTTTPPSNDSGAADTGSTLDSTTPSDTGSIADDSGTSNDASTDDSTVVDSGSTDDTGSSADSTSGDSAVADSSADAAEVAPLGFCASQTGLTFCDDFDDPHDLDPGKVKWDAMDTYTPPIFTLSSDHAVSAPNALFASFPGDPAPGMRFAKTLPNAAITSAEWNFDLYVEDLPPGIGFFLTDFQFVDDSGGSDRYGWRLTIFSTDAGGGIKEARIEHNAPSLGVGDVFEPDLPADAITMKAWTHLRYLATFDFSGAKPQSHFQLFVGGKSTPSVDKTYDAPTRDKVTFARIAGVPFLFQKPAGHKLRFDNETVVVK